MFLYRLATADPCVGSRLERVDPAVTASARVASVDELTKGLVLALLNGPEQKEWPSRLADNVQDVSASQTAQCAVRSR
jgi:hypothetical protein